MVPTWQRRTFTVQEYLQLERAASYKSEYFHGEIFAMAGASTAHNTISANIIALLWVQLRGRCRVLNSDMRIAIDALSSYAYADVSIVCGEPKLLAEPFHDNLTNPQVIFEVLSPSTEAYDRGEKFQQYKGIPSLTDYVPVAQDQVRVEHYRRDEDGAWAREVFATFTASLRIDSIGCSLALGEIYERVFDAV